MRFLEVVIALAIKEFDLADRVTLPSRPGNPPKRVTTPTWGPPLPCKQALRLWTV